MGVRIEPLKMNARGLSPVADAIVIIHYYRILRRIEPAALLTFTPKANIYASIAAHWAGTPVINTITGLGTGFLSGAILQRLVMILYRIALRSSAKVFFHNEDDRDLFLQLHMVTEDQATVVGGSGIDLAEFRPAIDSSRNTVPTFLFVGRLLRDKGVKEFADAARIAKVKRDARFQILGAPEAHPKAIPAEMLESWQREGIIELLGRTDDVRPHIARADCVVLPSYREGLPRAVLEASAMAKPVIATDVPGCRQAVESGATGLLCEARSSASLAEAILAMVDMPVDRRLAMGRCGREKVEREFSASSIASTYIRLLQDLGVLQKGSMPEKPRGSVEKWS
jgi:glycosyltransferase involved in cell wall biosynthesis